MPSQTDSAASPARSPTPRPACPRPSQARAYDERGRGLAIVTALATASGVRAEPVGKTTWFTLALRDRIDRAVPQAQTEAEAGA
jgi:hypothetical protein